MKTYENYLSNKLPSLALHYFLLLIEMKRKGEGKCVQQLSFFLFSVRYICHHRAVSLLFHCYHLFCRHFQLFLSILTQSHPLQSRSVSFSPFLLVHISHPSSISPSLYLHPPPLSLSPLFPAPLHIPFFLFITLLFLSSSLPHPLLLLPSSSSACFLLFPPLPSFPSILFLFL